MKIFIYIRKSSNHQSFARQIQLFKDYKYLLDDGKPNVEIGVHSIYTESISGRKELDDRKALQKMIQEIRAIKEEYPDEQIFVVSEAMTRLARTLLGVLEVIELINNEGAILKTLKEGFDFRSNSATSKLLITVIAAVNQFEVDQLKERVAEGMKATKKKIGRPTIPSKKVLAALDVVRNNTNHLSIQQIADAFGISKRTLYYAIKKNN